MIRREEIWRKARYKRVEGLLSLGGLFSYDGMGNEALLRFIFAGLENWRKLGRRYDSIHSLAPLHFWGGAQERLRVLMMNDYDTIYYLE
jgi:hypothetical protein